MLVGLTFVPGPALAGKCAEATGKAAVRYLAKATKGRQNCFARAIKDREDPADPEDAADDCFAPISALDTDEGIGKRLDRARKRMRMRLTKSCVGENLADLGFPGPCDTSNERKVCQYDQGASENFGHTCTTDTDCGGAGCTVVFDFFSYENCVVDKTDEVTLGRAGRTGILSFEHPASAGELDIDDDWSRLEMACQSSVARLAGAMFVTELKARAKCLAANGAAGGVDCRAQVTDEDGSSGGTNDKKTNKRIKRAHRKVVSGIIGVCPAVDLARLGFPHRCTWPETSLFTLSALAECMFDGHHLDLIRYLDTLAPPSTKCGNQAVPWDDILTAGTLDFTEECDDGSDDNAAAQCAQGATGGCGAYCTMECRVQACGDIDNSGELTGWDRDWIGNPGNRCDVEVCDTDGNGEVNQDDAERLNDYATALFLGLTPPTSLECRCGDGLVQKYEQCDDRGHGFCKNGGPGQGDPEEPCYSDSDCNGTVCLKNTDSCKEGCVRASCGDGILWAGIEECDDGAGNADSPDKCRTYCMLPMCNDGIVDAGESCDTDGESATCNSNCTRAVCGDSIVNVTAGESCDDSNTLDQDYCSPDCSQVTGRCGDTIVQSRLEECDSGESGSVDCDPDCTEAICGDGYANSAAGEQCDDGGTESGDGCSFNCFTEITP